MLKKTFLPARFSLLSLFLAFSSGVLAADPEVRINPVSVNASQEFGLIRGGQYTSGGNPASTVPFEDDWVDHFGASIGMSAVVNERLHVSTGLGGIFQFRKPESNNIGYEGSQRKAFFIGPATEAVYHFGENPERPFLKLGVGNGWYKYNPEAVNLGEYLFRSEGYPTYTMTGGYSIIGSAGAPLQGFKAMFRRGNATLDLFLTTETNLAPFYNWSPAAVFGYSVADGLLDLGAGVHFKHLFQIQPSRSRQKINENGYFRHDGEWYYAVSTYYGGRSQFYYGKGTGADSLRAIAEERKAFVVDSITAVPASDPTRPDFNYFDARSTLLMARATLDPKKLFESAVFGPQDLKIYSEIGVLGLRNYPLFYRSVTERMPVMAGVNLPAFRLLDLVAVQVEYMNSPYVNSTYARSVSGANVPFYPAPGDSVMSKGDYNDISRRDNFKWSLLVRKSLGRVTLSAQAASDHLRVPSSAYYYGPQFDPNEVTVTRRHWYLMSQIAWGI